MSFSFKKSNCSFFFRTGLIVASRSDSREVVKILIELKANVNASDFGGFTSLHYAARNGNKYILELLVTI